MRNAAAIRLAEELLVPSSCRGKAAASRCWYSAMTVSASQSRVGCKHVTYVHVLGQTVHDLIGGDMPVSIDVHTMGLMSQCFLELSRDDSLLL